MTSLQKNFLIIIATFIITIIGTIITYNIAKEAYEPITDKKYYEKGLNYQKIKDMDSKAIKEGWSIISDLFNQETLLDKQTFSIKLLNKSTNIISHKITASILIEQPATIKNRIELPFIIKNINNETILSTEIDFPKKGIWEVSSTILIDTDKRIVHTKKYLVE